MDRYELVYWKITDEQLARWKCLDPSFPRHLVHDCAINVLTFFDLLDRENAETIASYRNVEATQPDALRKGTYPDEITYYLFQIFSTDVKKDYRFNTFPFNENSELFLRSHIPPGHGTFMMMYTETVDEMGNTIKINGHAIIVSIDSIGTLVLIDPQQQLIYKDPTSIQEMITAGNYTHFLLLFSSLKRAHNLSKTMLTVRKEKNAQPSKRQRIGSGGTRKKRRNNRKTKSKHRKSKSKSKSK